MSSFKRVDIDGGAKLLHKYFIPSSLDQNISYSLGF